MYQGICALAHELRLHGMHRSLERRCQEALANGLHPSEIIRLLLEDEKQARQIAAAKRLVARARFRSPFQLEDWDGTFERGISKAKFKELALVNFFHRKINLIIVGKTGVGKTRLAISLGNRICQDGAPAQFYSTNLMFEEAQAEKAAGRYLKFIKKLQTIRALIFDDFALRNYSHDEATILMEILEERYSKGVTMITSQVSPAGWKSLFEDPVIAEAIIDRLINPSETIELLGDSYRQRLGKN